QGRRAVLQDLDALVRDRRRQRRRVDEVLGAVRRYGALRLTAAVDQHERRADAEPTKVHVARARREVLRERVGVVLRARVDRQVLEHAPDFVRARRREIVGGDGDERRRRLELRRAADVATGDDDRLDFLRRGRQRDGRGKRKGKR